MTGSTLSIIFISISFALLGAVLAYIIVSMVFADKIAAEKRLEELNRLEGDGTEISLVESKSKKHRNEEKERKHTKTTEKLAAALYDELKAADIKMRPEEYALIWIVLAFVPGSLAAMFISNAVIPIVLVVAGAVGPVVLIKMKQSSRNKKFESQLSDALMIACSSLKSGLSFNQAMESIAKDMDDPIAYEFSVVLKELAMGFSMDEALDNLNKRIKSKYVALMVSSVLVQRQTGGNLSEILESISETIKGKLKLKKQLKSSTSGGKMTAIIVGAMPFGLLFLFILVNPDVYKMVLTETRGHILLYIAVGLEFMCFIAVKKITSMKI